MDDIVNLTVTYLEVAQGTIGRRGGYIILLTRIIHNIHYLYFESGIKNSKYLYCEDEL